MYTDDMHPHMKHVIIVAVSILVLAAFGFLLIVYGDNSQTSLQVASVKGSAGADEEVTFSEIASGNNSSVKEKVNYLITTDEGLTKLWQMLDTSIAKPNVDLDKNNIIVVFSGEKQGGGYSVKVTRIHDSNVRDVTIESSSPGTNCIVTEAITYPYQVIVVPATTLELTHKDVSVIQDCEQ